MTDPDVASWRLYAACRGMDPELFHPVRGEDVRDAKAICRPCPVRRECLEYALAAREKHGVWGGLTERERRKLRARSRRVA